MVREYKDSGIEWIGRIPKDWNTEKAKYVFIQRREKGNKDCTLLAATQKFGMYPQHLLDGVVKVASGTDMQQFKTVHVNDFVISLRSFQGGFEMSDYEGVCSPAYQVFSAQKPINNIFFKYLFKSDAFIQQINAFVLGIREGKNIQYEDFSTMYLPIPSLTEQQRIASYLDKKCAEIDSLVELQEQMIAQLTDYKQSVITEAVTKGLNPEAELVSSGIDWIGDVPKGWNTQRLKYLCTIQTGNQDTQDSDPVGIYPFYVRSPIVERSNKYSFEGEGILMAGDGAGAGRVFHHVYGKYAVHQRVYRLANIKGINSDFLFYFLSSLFCKEMDRGSAQSTVPSVRLPMLQNFRVCMPSVEEQNDIVSYLDAKCREIDTLIDLKRQKIETLKDYKKSIIFEAVTGKTDLESLALIGRNHWH